MKRLFAWLLILLMLAACQPTPEEEFVKNKSDGKLEESLTVTAAPADGSKSRTTLAERLGAPDRWTEEAFSAKIPFNSTLTVHIDADVHIPDVERVGVYTVTFDVPFSESQQKALILKYLGDRESPFRVQEEGKKQRKWEIEEWIQYLQGQLEAYQKADDAEMREVMTAQTQEQLSQSMERYREAPDDWEHLDWDGKCLSGNGKEAGWITLYASTDQPAHYRRITFDAYGMDFRDETLVMSENEEDYRIPGKSERSAVQFEPETEAERKAAELAESTVNALGVGTFTVKSVSQGMNGFIGSTQKAENGYLVQLWMTKDGLPIYHFSAWHGDDPARERAEKAGYLEESDYSVFMPEQVHATVGVRDGRIASINVQGLHHETGCINSNAQLLPFDTIVKIFKDQIVYCYFVGSDDAKDDRDWDEHLYITDVYLSMMRVRKKDAPNEFYLLPVWDFGFRHENIWDRNVAEAGGPETHDMSMYSTLTINAIDGTIIDRNLGY